MRAGVIWTVEHLLAGEQCHVPGELRLYICVLGRHSEEPRKRGERVRKAQSGTVLGTIGAFFASLQAPEIDAAALNMLPNESREALLQTLLEQKLRSFATQVRLSHDLLSKLLSRSSGRSDSMASFQEECLSLILAVEHDEKF